jgi:hypothetical protein
VGARVVDSKISLVGWQFQIVGDWDSGFIAPWCHKVMKGVEERLFLFMC